MTKIVLVTGAKDRVEGEFVRHVSSSSKLYIHIAQTNILFTVPADAGQLLGAKDDDHAI